jgi:hypothetical protein
VGVELRAQKLMLNVEISGHVEISGPVEINILVKEIICKVTKVLLFIFFKSIS